MKMSNSFGNALFLALCLGAAFSFLQCKEPTPAKAKENGFAPIEELALAKPVATAKPKEPPANLGLKGDLVERAVFEDSYGEQVFGVALFQKGDFAEPGYTTEIHAAQWSPTDTGYTPKWKMMDLNGNALESIYYAPESYQTSDVDQNGKHEIAIWYRKITDGMDPDTLKLLMYVEGEKLAIRGLIPKIAEDALNYERNFDKAFDAYPEKFRSYASELWEQIVKRDLETISSETNP